MSLVYSSAVPGDASDCIALRAQTRQNAISEEQLQSMGITTESWAQAVRTSELTGQICRNNGTIVGYSFGSRKTGEIVVLALHPEFEKIGIGKTLLNAVVVELVLEGHKSFFLSCSSNPEDRSHGFYRHLGWRSTGRFEKNGDEILFLNAPRSGAAARDA